MDNAAGNGERTMFPRMRFDPTINYGHLAILAGFVVSLVIWGLRLEGRVDFERDMRQIVQEQWGKEVKRLETEAQRDTIRQASDFAELKQQIREFRQEMQGQLRRIEDELKQKADKPGR